jgi:hypothetical protein
MPKAPPSHPPRAVFRPRFTLTLLYLAFFFLVFGMIFALPDLLELVRTIEPGPEGYTPDQRDAARDTAREALRGGRLYVALGLAVIATGLGSYARVLPGLRGD